jgi:hypothetical protein
MTVESVLSDAKRQLMARMMSGHHGRTGGLAAAIRPRPQGIAVPLSAAQRHVWLHAAIAPDVPVYNESITIHRFGTFDLAALEAALNEILRRHEIWRTCFALDGAEPLQIVHPEITLRLELDDISHLPSDERDTAARNMATSDAVRPIDLARAPLLRARIVKLA